MYYQKSPDPMADFFSRLTATTLGVFIGGLLAWWAAATITRAELREAFQEIRELRSR